MNMWYGQEPMLSLTKRSWEITLPTLAPVGGECLLYTETGLKSKCYNFLMAVHCLSYN